MPALHPAMKVHPVHRAACRCLPARAALLALAGAAAGCQTLPAKDGFQQDFDVAVESIASTYAYFDDKATRWHDIPALYAAERNAVRNRDELVALLERVLDELYDPHLQLTTNLARSPRLVPSGTDLWAEWLDGRATITQLRSGSDAERAGLRAGMVVLAADGRRIDAAVEARVGRSYAHSVPAARDWALRAVLAGRHDTPRLLEVRDGGATRTVELPAADQVGGTGALLDASEIRPGIGYIRINDSLGDGDLVAAFDRALDSLRHTRGLIVDLRDTARGGNSTVARGILGRFVERDLPYQKHVLTAEERETGIRRSWLELVSRRGDFVYSRPVAVLVGRWTGSMGEGLALGFDATKAGTVIGTAMAGLVGATTQVTLPHSGIGINVPAERLYHVRGTPREQFRPAVHVDVGRAAPGADPFVEAALRSLHAR
jgi:C-terminal processing protease CtpA/Prc